MPDPITDLRNGVNDATLKKKYNLKDEDIFTLRKYDYATTKGGLSADDALEIYPDVSKYISAGSTKPLSKGSIIPDIQLQKPASESTSVKQPKQSLDKFETDVRNNEGVDAAESVVKNSQVNAGKSIIEKQTGVPIALQPVKTPVTDAPQEISTEETKNQAAADAFYETPAGKSYYNFVQSVWKPMVEGGGGMIAGALRAPKSVANAIGLGDGKTSEIADAIVDYFDFDKRSKQDRGDAALYATPTKLQGGLINDGRMNTAKFFPSLIENVTNMAVLLAGGELMGSGKAGLVASSYLNTAEDYRKEGKEAGLKGGQLDAFSNTAAGLTSFLEVLSPNNPIMGKFKKTLLKGATKDIATGVSVTTAVKRAGKEFLKENGKEVVQELSQNAADHVTKAGFGVDEHMTYGSIRDEIAETVLMTVLPTTLLMSHNTLRHHRPSTQEISSLNYAAENPQEFSQAVDKSTAAGKYTPEQAQTMKDNVGIYSTKVQQMKALGYSADQSANGGFAAYKDAKVNQNAKAIDESPVLKATIGEEAKKDQEELKNEVKDVVLGIPEMGTELSGEDLSQIVLNTPNSPKNLPDKIADKDFRVEEIDLQEKYDNESAFKKRVDEFEKSKEDPEGLRTPAIIDVDGKVLDGKKRLVQQYVNGNKTARVFKELKPQESTENTTEPINETAEDIGNQVEQTEKSPQEIPQESQSISGISRDAREKIILQRKAKTNLSDRQEKINALSQDADKYSNLPKGNLGKAKPEGVKLLNDIRLRAKELKLTYDPGGNTLKNEKGTKVQKRFLAASNQAIIENHVALTQRLPEIQKTFKTLHESTPDKSNAALFFPNDIKGIDGKVMSDSQLNSTLEDIFNGIPSVQAENYLNEFEKMVKDGNVLLIDQGNSFSVPLQEYMQLMTEAKNEVDAILDEGRLPIPDDVAEQWLQEMEKEMSDPAFQEWYNSNNLADYGSDQNTQADSEEQASDRGSTGQDESRTAGENYQTDVSEDGPGSVRQEAFQEVAGLAPSARIGGIQVDPIMGGSPKDLSRIILDVGHGLKQNIFFSKVRRRAAGTYAPGSTAVKIKYSGDLDTTAHEIGHAIDDKYDIITAVLAHPRALSELPQFSRFGSKPPKGHPNPAKYEANEGFAEFLRAYIVNPTEAKAKAPGIFEVYDSKVPDAAKKVIDQFSFDFRTWAGATGQDITKANIQFKPEEKPGIISRVFAKKLTNKEFSINIWDKLAANFVNPLSVFEKSFEYAKQVKGVSDVLPQDNPTLLARLLLGIDGKFGQILKNGMIDSENNVLTDKNGKVKNLKWLLEPLDNSDIASVERDMQDVITYMISERTVELGKRLGKESIISGVGGGVFTDVEIAQKTLDEYNNSDPDKLARLKEAGERYREMADDTLKYLVDKGRMAKDQYDKIKADNTQYVAMQRVLETEPEMEVTVYKGSGGKLTSVAEPVKKIKGSTKKISNPYTSLLDTLHKSIKEADRNEVMRAFRDMLVDPRSMNQGQPKRLADIGTIAMEGDKNTHTIFIDGKAEKWKFQQDVYESLNGLDHDKYHLPGALKLYGSVLRTMTTKFPTFALRNWVRDIQDRLIKSNDKSGFMDLFGNPEDWNQVERVGGLNAGYYAKSKEMYYGLMEEAMNQVAKKKGFILANPSRLKSVWNAYENVLFKSETSNRVAEYRAAFRQAKKQGMDDYNASLYGAFKSRDLMDFAVAGHVMKVVNQMIPFSNAAVQGMRSAAVRAKENPLGFLARTMIYSVGPQILVWLWNHQDEDDGEQYENLPAYQRDLFWNIKLGPNNWLALPKPYELSAAGAGVDRALSSAWGNEKAFDGYGGTAAKLIIPFDEGTAFGPLKPIVENIANYDAFREKSIISPFENVLNLSLRNTQTASRLGQVIQSAAGIDARKADHFIQSTFSYVGKTAMKLSDIGRDESKNKFDFTDFGVFKSSPGYNSAPVQEMMKFAVEYQLTRGRDYQRFQKMSKEYFDAKGNDEKEKAGDELINFSKELLQKWEDEGIIQKKSDKAEAKRNKTKVASETILP